MNRDFSKAEMPSPLERSLFKGDNSVSHETIIVNPANGIEQRKYDEQHAAEFTEAGKFNGEKTIKLYQD